MITPPNTILELIERFDQNHQAYHSDPYNETQLRREFLDPFFETLGWDINNKQGYAEAYKDVIHEDAIRVGGVTKAPDYCFCIGGTRKFFIEAKKPSIRIKEDIHSAFQLRRYAWSAKLPLSILTNFEELAIYDCRIKPDKADKAATARILYFTYQDYVRYWEEIASIFSHEAVLKGSFDKYAEAGKGKKGTAEVDTAFLKEIESWRELLARNLALRNPELTQRELNFSVQRTIDRIIFLRICEDRGIEDYNRLLSLVNGTNVFRRLDHFFRLADERYNSGLFHFSLEKGRNEEPDRLTPNLIIDDAPLKQIIKDLYYPDSPYEFSVLPADILGQVYEQFLGKVIRLTTGHRAVVEDKPEVKKAGGVYYTPTYIVEYIVKNTVGKLVAGKTPKQVAQIRILDPACGSGSFLINAYQNLLDWHLEWYQKNTPQKWATGRSPVLSRGHKGEWKLTTAERKRILLNNIYGVDIDSQAVEVTKLSLLLKVLEGENEHTLARQLKLFRERALPDLGNNIKCGNSLIGPDFSHGQQLSFLNEEEVYRINAFDWKTEFLEAMKSGGFDAVIGNPPYIRIQALKEWAPIEVEVYKKRYASAGKGNYDIYVVFVEKGLSLLNPKGGLGFILPHKFFNSQYGQPLRNIISKGNHLSQIVHFGAQQVFVGATTYTCLLFLDKAGTGKFQYFKVDDLKDWSKTRKANERTIPSTRITSAEWNFTVGESAGLFEKLNGIPIKLGDIADIFVGLQTSADDVFIMDFVEETPRTLRLKSKSLGDDWIFEKGILFPLVSGTDVNRYCTLASRQYILFPYRIESSVVNLIDFNLISKNYPRTAAYLLKNKKRLEDREKGKAKGTHWYGYIYLKNMARQSFPKLCVPRLVDKLYAAYDQDGSHFLDNVDVGGIDLKPAYQELGLAYLH
jgi:type I restriction-modification system DNA methylase subunit